MNEVRAVLLDLYDTLAWTEWKTMRIELEERLGLERKALLRAFDRSRPSAAPEPSGAPRATWRAILRPPASTPTPSWSAS